MKLSSRIQYSKYYIILAEDDKGFGLTSEPKGIARFEIKDDACLIKITIENLIDPSPDYSYSCFLICKTANSLIFHHLSDITINNGKGTINIKVPSNKINNSKNDIQEFDIITILNNPKNVSSSALKFPLTGYRNNSTIWKNEFCHLFCSSVSHKTDDISLNPSNTRDMEKIKIESTVPQASIENSSSTTDFNLLYNNASQDSRSPEKIVKSKNNEANPKQNNTEKLKNLENILSLTFSKYKPFSISDNSMKWWKVDNYQKIKQLLLSMELPDLAVLNNYLHIYYYVYGYFIIGINTSDKAAQFVFGIPSIYGIDPKPLNLSCSWKSESNSSAYYGEFGYWLIKYNFETENAHVK